ncbi:hypothetical protein BH24CHL2_BH24CHL2_6710 [soil metagenome]
MTETYWLLGLIISCLSDPCLELVTACNLLVAIRPADRRSDVAKKYPAKKPKPAKITPADIMRPGGKPPGGYYRPNPPEK